MISYNLHGLIEVRLAGDDRRYKRYFDNEYLRIHQSSNVPAPARVRVTVHIVNRLPEPRCGDICRAVHFKRLLRLAFLVRAIDEHEVHIFFRRHPVDRLYVTATGVFLQAHVLEPLMYMKLLAQDVMLLHAAGVSDSRGAYLFPASGGTGKTTLSLALMQEGYHFLGDDLLLVNARSGTVYPYPRPLHLFTYNVASLVGGHVPLRVRAAVRAKDALRVPLQQITGQHLLISTRVHADQIYPGIEYGQPVKLRRITFLAKRTESESTSLSANSAAANAASMLLDASDLNKSLYELLSDARRIAAVRREENRVIEMLLGHVPQLFVLDPRDTPRADLIGAMRS